MSELDREYREMGGENTQWVIELKKWLHNCIEYGDYPEPADVLQKIAELERISQ